MTSIPQETVIPPDIPELSEKDFRRALDEYLSTGSMHCEDYVGMSPFQQNIIQQIKKSTKRLKYRIWKLGEKA